MPAFPGARSFGAERRSDGVHDGALPIVDRWLLAGLRRLLYGAPIRVVLWNGASSMPVEPPIATLVFKSRRALLDVVRDPDMGFGEGYSRGRIEVHGDLAGMLETAYRALPDRPTRRLRTLSSRIIRNTVPNSRRNVHHHYDIGNDFYRLWLDTQLVYTCAYFPTPEAPLEAAQIAKLDHVCRKLRLRPGERVAEAGCGWGALALHMARHYGVHVKAFNLSKAQIAYARERARREGLADRVEFFEDDYRNVSGTFDVFVSVGMIEHVGLDHYRDLGGVMHRTLDRARGRGLLHFIGRDWPRPLSRWISRRIFPGGYIPTLSQVTEGVLQPWSFSVIDVENLRLHYARTLEHWLERFERHREHVEQMFDEEFVRTWRLYLASSQASFAAGTLQLFQITFTRSRLNDIPWNRAELYRA